MSDFKSIIEFIRSRFPNQDFIPLHAPVFLGNERKYVLEAIDSTFVSSVGKFVGRFEKMVAQVAGTRHAVATVNGTSALHMALIVGGVKAQDEVLTQSLTFVATVNAIVYTGATPVFLDVDRDTMGLSPDALRSFLNEHAELKGRKAYNRKTGKCITACVPMHSFGHPCRIEEIRLICDEWYIPLIEDAAESLGSFYKGKHTGSFGLLGTFSFNGNKIVTCGGGGAIVTDDEKLARLAKYLTTQAKVPHSWEFNHDMIGYNYRMPNLNAAMICAQLEQLDSFVHSKRELAEQYQTFFSKLNIRFKKELAEAKSNYWLNVIELNDIEERNDFLKYSNRCGVMVRPAWNLMTNLPMFRGHQCDALQNSIYLSERIVNIPSSVTT